MRNQHYDAAHRAGQAAVALLIAALFLIAHTFDAHDPYTAQAVESKCDGGKPSEQP